jgi:hypothetical protein
MRSIAVDGQGYVWICTGNGLLRFKPDATGAMRYPRRTDARRTDGAVVRSLAQGRSVVFSFASKEKKPVDVTIYSMNGTVVKRIPHVTAPYVVWNTAHTPRGIYLAVFRSGKIIRTVKTMVVR